MHFNKYKTGNDSCSFIRKTIVFEREITMDDSDVIYGPLDESEEAVAAVNELAEKNDDPDMQVNERSSRSFFDSMGEI